MVPHVLSSTNCGLGCFKNNTKYFLCTNSHFLSGMTTTQAVDPLPLYRYFPAIGYLLNLLSCLTLSQNHLFLFFRQLIVPYVQNFLKESSYVEK
jgi:hypothetical protein